MEAAKKRFMRDLRAGRRKTISQQVINKYNWTVDEKKILEPYISLYDPHDIQEDVPSPDECFTKREVYETLDEHVKNEYTMKNYKARVNALLSLMNVTNQSFSNIFTDIDKLKEAISKRYKDPTSYYAFMLYVLSKSQKLLDCVPNNTYDEIKKLFDDAKTKQTIKTLKNRREDVNFQRVYQHVFKTEARLAKQEYASMKHIISVLYSHALYDDEDVIHMNPRNYFLKVLVVDADKDMDQVNNFYNHLSGRMLLNDYKTAAIYEPYDVVFTEYVRTAITESLKKTPRKYLIEKSEGGLYANNSLSKIVKDIFGGYTIDDIRKSIESYEINVKGTDRGHLANVSRHTVVTQEVSYLAQ